MAIYKSAVRNASKKRVLDYLVGNDRWLIENAWIGGFCEKKNPMKPSS